MPADLIHKELSETIIGAAMQVLNTLKPGSATWPSANSNWHFSSTLSTRN